MNIALLQLLSVKSLRVLFHPSDKTIDSFVIFVEKIWSDVVVVMLDPVFELGLLVVKGFLLAFSFLGLVRIEHYSFDIINICLSYFDRVFIEIVIY